MKSLCQTICTMFLVVNPGITQPLTIQQCVDAAVSHFPVSGNTELIIEQYDLQAKLIRTALYPQSEMIALGKYQSDVVEFDLGVQIPGLTLPDIPHVQYQVALDLSQVLYDGGVSQTRLSLNLKQKEADLKAVKLSVYQIRQKTEEVFMNILALRSQLPVFSFQNDLLSAMESEMIHREQSGLAVSSDLYQIQAGKLELHKQEAHLQSLIAAQIESLKLLTGLEIQDDAEWIIPVPPELSDSPVQRPEISLWNTSREVLNMQGQLVTRDRLPKIAAFAQSGYGRPGLNFFNDQSDAFFLGGIRASWKIWDWNAAKNQTRILHLESEKIEHHMESFLTELQIQLFQIRLQMIRVEDAIHTGHKLATLYEQISVTAREQYLGGVILFSDYLGHLNQLRKCRQQLEIDEIELLRLKQLYNTLSHAKD